MVLAGNMVKDYHFGPGTTPDTRRTAELNENFGNIDANIDELRVEIDKIKEQLRDIHEGLILIMERMKTS